MSEKHSIALPSAVASLQQYIELVNRFPMLEADAERDLARRWRDNHDLDAAWQLVASHLRYVVRIARGYQGYGLAQEDLVQEGNIGLTKAVRRFDPERGVRLLAYAVHWIRVPAVRRRSSSITAAHCDELGRCAEEPVSEERPDAPVLTASQAEVAVRSEAPRFRPRQSAA